MGSVAYCSADCVFTMPILFDAGDIFGNSCGDSGFSNEFGLFLRLCHCYCFHRHRMVRHCRIYSHFTCRVRFLVTFVFFFCLLYLGSFCFSSLLISFVFCWSNLNDRIIFVFAITLAWDDFKWSNVVSEDSYNRPELGWDGCVVVVAADAVF